MIKYPLQFKVKAEATSGIQNVWTAWAESHDQKLVMAVPPEFNGPGNGLSPEDLYALALENCFIATFKVFAEKSKLDFSHLAAKADLEVDRDEQGHPWMARIHLVVDLYGVTQVENGQRLLEKASKSCMILNSVKSEKKFSFQVHSP